MTRIENYLLQMFGGMAGAGLIWLARRAWFFFQRFDISFIGICNTIASPPAISFILGVLIGQCIFGGKTKKPKRSRVVLAPDEEITHYRPKR